MLAPGGAGGIGSALLQNQYNIPDHAGDDRFDPAAGQDAIRLHLDPRAMLGT